MRRASSRSRRVSRSEAPPAEPRAARAGCAVAWWALALTLLGTAWAVDPWAEASFDAPKRLVWMVGAVVAAAAVWWGAVPTLDLRAWRRWPLPARAAGAAGVMLALGAFVSASLSPHQAIAWGSLRTAVVAALLAAVGASRVFDDAHWRRLLMIAAAAVGLNAALSMAQAAGLSLPLPIARLGGRLPGGALLGNEGYVAIASALLGAGGLAIGLSAAPPWVRRLGAAAAALGAAAVVVNRNTTGVAALAVAAAVIVCVRLRRPHGVTVLTAALVLAGLAATVPPVRQATWDRVLDAAVVPVTAGNGRPLPILERYDRLTTYRLGAWVAAAGMIADRPLAGFGPGTFGVEFLPHRLDAERRLHARFVQPAGSTFVQAHQDYLQLAAEAGLPAAVCGAAGVALLLGWLVFAPSGRDAADPERLVLAGVISSGAVAALAWFPFQIPLTATILLLALGRAWSLVRHPGPGDGA
jgi:O-antigen ligase